MIRILTTEYDHRAVCVIANDGQSVALCPICRREMEEVDCQVGYRGDEVGLVFQGGPKCTAELIVWRWRGDPNQRPPLEVFEIRPCKVPS